MFTATIICPKEDLSVAKSRFAENKRERDRHYSIKRPRLIELMW